MTTGIGVFVGGFTGLWSASDIERPAPEADAALPEYSSTGKGRTKE
jgi:hypothetical protein